MYPSGNLAATLGTTFAKGLSRIERLENIEQQFVATPQSSSLSKVLIIDDVVTTGSSITALSHVLQQLGCQQIYSIV